MRKILTVLLVCVMVLGMASIPVFAEEAPALPTATVTKIENENLTFALNFKADEITEEQLTYYGSWYADFVLTVNKDITFNADGNADGYLSGQYDAWSENWVDVPFEDVTLGAGQSLKIMEYAAVLMGEPGLKYTYKEVYEVVKDFDCGVYISPAFMAENPDFNVTLELRMYNNADETESYAIGKTYTYNVWDTATDASAEHGILRFLFGTAIDGEIEEYGIKYSSAADIAKDVLTGVVSSAAGNANAFYGDLVGIASDSTDTYYAAAYVKIAGEYYWSDIISAGILTGGAE